MSISFSLSTAWESTARAIRLDEQDNRELNNEESSPVVLTSCRYDRFDTVKPVYKMVTHENENLTDPTLYLEQGSYIENFDAYQALWQDSFRVLRVTDRFKHTTGSVSSEPIATNKIEADDSFDTTIAHPLLAVSLERPLPRQQRKSSLGGRTGNGSTTRARKS